MRKLPYRVHDADNHYYEPDDCFTRHIEARFKDRTMWIDRCDDGPSRMYIGRERCHFFSVGAGDSVGPPGIMKAFLRGESNEGGSPSLRPINALAVPEFVNKRARLAKMDEQDVESCLMLPTTGVGIEPQLRETPDILYPSVRAFNRWLEEDWGFGGDGRIYGAPLLSLFDLPQALGELDRVILAGARFVVLTAGPPVLGHSPAEPAYDPFWARCAEADINVLFHIGRTPFSEMYNTPWGLRPHPPSHRHSLMEMALSFTERPVVDTITALISDNLFGRFPKLKILTVEYGSSWVAPLLHKLDHIARLFSKDMWRFGMPPLPPSETFRQNVWVAPFFEDDVVALARLIGPSHVLNGSDYPHPEGLEWPVEFVDELEGLSEVDVRLIMRDNFEQLRGASE
ncbi:MAG TPA: amidohydrolase family protein [Candidatus Acidoferrales bacterium]|nr:amidohydrolase family protein [Candidatus Acidoferrales bacterium]